MFIEEPVLSEACRRRCAKIANHNRHAHSPLGERAGSLALGTSRRFLSDGGGGHPSSPIPSHCRRHHRDEKDRGHGGSLRCGRWRCIVRWDRSRWAACLPAGCGLLQCRDPGTESGHSLQPGRTTCWIMSPNPSVFAYRPDGHVAIPRGGPGLGITSMKKRWARGRGPLVHRWRPAACGRHQDGSFAEW